jgi:hypothetical protein
MMDEPTNRDVMNAVINLRDGMGERIDRLSEELKNGFHNVDIRFDRLERRVGNIETRVENIEGEVTRLKRRRR